MPAARYPDTLHGPAPKVDLGNRAERARLSASGLNAFFRIASAWGLSNTEANRLLGGLSNGKFYELKRKAESGQAVTTLSQDQATRVSLVLGIYKALHILFDETLADDWMQRPNAGRMFGGRSALDYAVEGGIPALFEIRRMLDARRGYPG
jgi:uncharacterized protein (DUF2384 family)